MAYGAIENNTDGNRHVMTKKEIMIVFFAFWVAHMTYNQLHDCQMAGGKFSFNTVWFVCEK
jgi:hypothetical protein